MYGIMLKTKEEMGRGAFGKIRGIYTREGGMVRDAPWRKLGGECCDDNDAFARIYNNFLLLHEYIYYFTPVHF